jgi:hypothetical protein
MKRVTVATFLLVLALVPLVLLAALALVGARAHVGVVTTGAGDHALLGAAWVAAWLAAVVLSPVLAVAAAVAAAATRALSGRRAASTPRGRVATS